MSASTSQFVQRSRPAFAGLLQGFLESAERFPQRPALLVNDSEVTYESLCYRAGKIAAAIGEFQQEDYPLGAILGSRSITTYCGILGVLCSGKGYVPLNPKFPIERTAKMLARSGAKVLIADAKASAQLPEILARLESSIAVILPDNEDVSGLAASFSQQRFISSRDLAVRDSHSFSSEVSPGDTAYLLFTSGSTGEPKGVPISHANVRAYVETTCRNYDVNEHDRVSQEFDLTFDLSVHDMFVAWERGACLCCVPEAAVMAPAKFIRDSRLTLWFSVPSVAGFLSKMRLLAPGCFPTLRCSLFCGEPLPAAYAQAWQEAAPNSIVENLYGPTETTIAITRYRWDPRTSPAECLNGIVPIGTPLEGQEARIISEDLRALTRGATGELCLAGSQVTSGYWHDPYKTTKHFVRLHGDGETVWYRTGDLAELRSDGCLRYIGRVDQQVKIRGYRVELQEIEGILREAAATEQVVAVPWPISFGNADGVVAVIAASNPIDVERVLQRCRAALPDYMVPRAIYQVDEMPLNANGKLDRRKLAQRLEENSL